MSPNPRYWPKGAGAREREAAEREPIHDEPTSPAAEHVASLADQFSIRTRFAAWDQNDPLPWAWAVLDERSVLVGQGWAGTEDEAQEYAAEWRDRYIGGDWDMT